MKLLLTSGGVTNPNIDSALVQLRRWELAPPAARARGDQGNRRLHGRWDSLTARRRRLVIANVAIARELAGRCWSLAVMDE